MDDVDEFLAAAIRTAWLQVDGPASRSQYHIGVETARRVRSVLERQGFVITRRPLKEKSSDFDGVDQFNPIAPSLNSRPIAFEDIAASHPGTKAKAGTRIL